MREENLAKLDSHIANVEMARDYAEDLKTDTDAFERYLGGLRSARNLMVFGEINPEAAKQPEQDHAG